jgi:hypothetical protein
MSAYQSSPDYLDYRGLVKRWQALAKSDPSPAPEGHAELLPEPITVMVDQMAAQDPALADVFARYGGHEEYLATPYLNAEGRDKLMQQIDEEQAAIRAEYERNIGWLLQVIEFEPARVRQALGCRCSECCCE